MISAKTCRQRLFGRGLSLPEVLIAGSLMLLVLGVSAELTRMAYRTFARASDSTEVFREQTIATDLLNRELRLCTKILSPGKDHETLYKPGAGDKPLVFQRFSPTLKAETVVSYRLQGTDLIRESFQPGYDPDNLGTQKLETGRSPKVVASRVEEFVFKTIRPDENYGSFLVDFQIQVKTGEGNSRIGSKIRVRRI